MQLNFFCVKFSSVLRLFLKGEDLLVYGAADDTVIKVWNTDGAVLKSYSGHFSTVTDLVVTPDFAHVIR